MYSTQTSVQRNWLESRDHKDGVASIIHTARPSHPTTRNPAKAGPLPLPLYHYPDQVAKRQRSLAAKFRLEEKFVEVFLYLMERRP